MSISKGSLGNRAMSDPSLEHPSRADQSGQGSRTAGKPRLPPWLEMIMNDAPSVPLPEIENGGEAATSHHSPANLAALNRSNAASSSRKRKGNGEDTGIASHDVKRRATVTAELLAPDTLDPRNLIDRAPEDPMGPRTRATDGALPAALQDSDYETESESETDLGMEIEATARSASQEGATRVLIGAKPPTLIGTDVPVFPIADPADPSRVHPDYADPTDPAGKRCSPNVEVVGIEFFNARRRDGLYGSYTLTHLHTYAAAMAAEIGRPPLTLRAFNNQLQASCIKELEASLKLKTPPSAQYLELKEVDAGTSVPGPKRTHGVFLKNYSPVNQPTVGNGMILGFVAGSKCTSTEEIDAYKSACVTPELAGRAVVDHGVRFNGLDFPELKNQSQVTYLPFGGGNWTQSLNVPYKNDGDNLGGLVSDPDVSHVDLFPVQVELLDANGKLRKELLMAVVQTVLVQKEGAQLLLYPGEVTFEPGDQTVYDFIGDAQV